MINRHLVLQEERVLPFVELLTSEEQVSLLKQIEHFERDELGANGRVRYEQWLTYIEGRIKAVAGRVW